MIYGYVRVSRVIDDEKFQIDKLNQLGVDEIFIDHATTSKDQRPEFERLMKILSTDDCVAVINLTKFSPTITNCIKSIKQITVRDCSLLSIYDNIDSRENKAIENVFNAIYETEKELMNQRCSIGLGSRNNVGGRKKSITGKKCKEVESLYMRGFPASKICKIVGCSKSTVFKYLQEVGLSNGQKQNNDNKKTYVMYNNRTGMYKIGRSNNPKHREKTLQSEEPDVELIEQTNIDIESILHKKYKDKRVRGEWFNLSGRDFVELLSIFKEPEKAIL